MKTIFFDLETTGLSSATASILEIAAVVIDENYNTIDSFQSFINPGSSIPYQITQITGITNDMVKHSRSEAVVLNDFTQFIRRNQASIVAGHNIKRFDLKWIEAKTNKYGITNALAGLGIVDTLELSKALHKDGVLKGYDAVTAAGNSSFKLEHLVKYFGLAAQTHRAIDDVYQNIIVYKNLKSLEKPIDLGF